AYAQAPQYQHLWLPGPGLRHLPLLLMPLVFILLAAGVTAKNPTAVKGEDALDRQDAVQGILRVTRHPVQWAILLWAALHILANGDLASLIFFGGFFILAAAGPFLIDRKLAAAQGARWERFAAATSNVPFAAILRGRQRLALAEIGWRPVVIGLAAYVLVLALHPWLFGASPG
ncbi:MAG: NnrU family protein, partial [Pseudomonadota bacterium]|nr:NnrU family protein [Pseudomonadota bacterium]